MGKTTVVGPGLTPEVAILPVNGVEFGLILKSPIDGLKLVHLFGSRPRGWCYTGQLMTGSFTRRFKLESVGDCTDLEDVRDKLVPFGNIPQGQWLQVFREVYPQNDGWGPIGVADPSWVRPDDELGERFPVVYRGLLGDWRPRFGHTQNARGVRWRWLVEVK